MCKSLPLFVFLLVFGSCFLSVSSHSVDVNGKYKYVFLKMEKNCKANNNYPQVVEFTEREAREFDMIVQLVGKHSFNSTFKNFEGGEPRLEFHDHEGKVVEEIKVGQMDQDQIVEVLEAHGLERKSRQELKKEAQEYYEKLKETAPKEENPYKKDL